MLEVAAVVVVIVMVYPKVNVWEIHQHPEYSTPVSPFFLISNIKQLSKSLNLTDEIHLKLYANKSASKSEDSVEMERSADCDDDDDDDDLRTASCLSSIQRLFFDDCDSSVA